MTIILKINYTVSMPPFQKITYFQNKKKLFQKLEANDLQYLHWPCYNSLRAYLLSVLFLYQKRSDPCLLVFNKKGLCLDAANLIL